MSRKDETFVWSKRATKPGPVQSLATVSEGGIVVEHSNPLHSSEGLKCKMAFQCLRIASNLMAVTEKLPIEKQCVPGLHNTADKIAFGFLV